MLPDFDDTFVQPLLEVATFGAQLRYEKFANHVEARRFDEAYRELIQLENSAEGLQSASERCGTEASEPKGVVSFATMRVLKAQILAGAGVPARERLKKVERECKALEREEFEGANGDEAVTEWPSCGFQRLGTLLLLSPQRSLTSGPKGSRATWKISSSFLVRSVNRTRGSMV